MFDATVVDCNNFGYFLQWKRYTQWLKLSNILSNWISFLYNRYPRSYPSFEGNHDFTIGYILSKFYTVGHRNTTYFLHVFMLYDLKDIIIML